MFQLIDVLAQQLYEGNSKDLSHVAHGRDCENGVKTIIAHKFSDYTFRNTGLIVNPFYPFLGASPDGLLYAPGDPILVEIKCVYNPTKLSLNSLVMLRKNFCLEVDENKGFKLRDNHAYMYQIQGQMALANINECYFVLYFKENEPVFVERIIFNKSMWEGMFLKLKDFYFKFYLPLLTIKESIF